MIANHYITYKNCKLPLHRIGQECKLNANTQWSSASLNFLHLKTAVSLRQAVPSARTGRPEASLPNLILEQGLLPPPYYAILCNHQKDRWRQRHQNDALGFHYWRLITLRSHHTQPTQKDPFSILYCISRWSPYRLTKNAVHENDTPNIRTWNCRMWKYRTWKCTWNHNSWICTYTHN